MDVLEPEQTIFLVLVFALFLPAQNIVLGAYFRKERLLSSGLGFDVSQNLNHLVVRVVFELHDVYLVARVVGPDEVQEVVEDLVSLLELNHGVQQPAEVDSDCSAFFEEGRRDDQPGDTN